MFKNKKSLVFRLRGLREGAHPVEADVSAEELGIENVVGPIHLHGELLVSDHYLFRLVIVITQLFICDRCADEFEKTLQIPLEIIYSPIEASAELEDSGYLHTFEPSDLFEVDITDDVHDAVLLAVPMKNLCRADCPGVNYTNSDDEQAVEYDTRFASLGGLYEKLKSEEKPM